MRSSFLRCLFGRSALGLGGSSSGSLAGGGLLSGQAFSGSTLGSGAFGSFGFGGGTRRCFTFLGLALGACSRCSGFSGGLLCGLAFGFKAFGLQAFRLAAGGLRAFSCCTFSCCALGFGTLGFRAGNTFGLQSLRLGALCRRTCGLGLLRGQAFSSLTFSGFTFGSRLRSCDGLCIGFGGWLKRRFSSRLKSRFNGFRFCRSVLGLGGHAGGFDQGQGFALLALLRALAALLAAQQEDDKRRQCDREEEERQQLHEDKGQWVCESIGPGALRRGVSALRPAAAEP